MNTRIGLWSMFSAGLLFAGSATADAQVRTVNSNLYRSNLTKPAIKPLSTFRPNNAGFNNYVPNANVFGLYPIPYGVNPYGYNPSGISSYGVNPYGVNPYGYNPYGVNPYGYNPYSTYQGFYPGVFNPYLYFPGGFIPGF